MSGIGLSVLIESHSLHQTHRSLNRQGKKGEISFNVLKSVFYLMLKKTESITSLHYRWLVWDLFVSHAFSSIWSYNLPFKIVYFSPHLYCYFALFSLHWSVSNLFEFDSINLSSNFIFWNSHRVLYLLWPKKVETYGFRNDTSERPFVKWQKCDCDFFFSNMIFLEVVYPS